MGSYACFDRRAAIRQAELRFFVGFDYSDDALREIDAFFRKSGKVIVALAVKEILEEQLAKKLA
jgi:hypothetical protein